jgi:hypothetical protein
MTPRCCWCNGSANPTGWRADTTCPPRLSRFCAATPRGQERPPGDPPAAHQPRPYVLRGAAAPRPLRPAHAGKLEQRPGLLPVRLLQMLGPPVHEGELQKIATAATAKVTAWNKRAARGGPRETWRRRRAGASPAAASEFRRVSARSCMLSLSESSRLATAAAAAALPASSRSPRMVSTISVTRGAERAGDIGLAEVAGSLPRHGGPSLPVLPVASPRASIVARRILRRRPRT